MKGFKIEDKIYLQKQREPGRPGYLAGVDRKLAEKEERARLRKLTEEKKKLKQLSLENLMSSAPSHSSITPEELLNTSTTSSEESVEEPLPSTSQSVSSSVEKTKRGRKLYVLVAMVTL